jgi:hypothetical protein
MMLGKFAREAAATLLRFSKSTSDPKLAAALVDKAADITASADDLSLPTIDKSPLAPDVDRAGRGGPKRRTMASSLSVIAGVTRPPTLAGSCRAS